MAYEVHNGMAAGLLHGAAWHKSSRSGAQGNCVELAALPDDLIAVRNSRHPHGPVLIHTRAELAAFIAGTAVK